MIAATDGRSSDIVVVGGGPAGCVAAKRLSEAGLAVTLVAGRRSLVAYEGLSDRTLEALRTLGCVNGRNAVGPTVTRVVTWNGETSSRNREHLVDRSAFDAALLADAAAAGATIVRGRVTSIRPCPDGWLVSHRADGGATSPMPAGFLVEARGRAAPRGRGSRVAGPATIALGQARVDGVGRPRSAVASCCAGWAWFIAPGDGSALLQLIVAARSGGVPKREDLPAFFDAHLAELAAAEEWLSGTRATGAVVARHATPWLSRPVLGDRFLRVGDAAVAVDPLSGHGVFEAIGGALAAVPVIRTVLERPSDAAIAARFYRERTEDTFRRYARAGRYFYAAEQRWLDHPFWGERRIWPEGGTARPPVATAPAVARRPVIEDGFVAERDVVVTHDHPRGIWGISDVPVVALLRFLESRVGDPWDVAAAGAAKAFGKSPDQIEAAMRWLSMRGLLDWERAAIDAGAPSAPE